MDWEMSEVLLFLILIFVFFKCEKWFENQVIKLIVYFLPYTFSFFVKVSKIYFNFIYESFIFLKNIFFIPLIPPFFQCLLTFSILFSYIWDCYLLFIIYTLIFVCFPKYLYNFFSKNQTANFFYIYQIKFAVFTWLYLNYSVQISLNTIFIL